MSGEDDPAGEFANTCTEVHAIWFGVLDAIFLFRPGVEDYPEALEEPQYYMLGTLLGKAFLVGIGMTLMYLGLT